MSELQLGLVSLGLAILLGVVAYNAWRRFRVRRMLPRSSPARRAAGLEQQMPLKTQSGQGQSSVMQHTEGPAYAEEEKVHPWDEDAQSSVEPTASLEVGVPDALQGAEPVSLSKKTKWWWPWTKGAEKRLGEERETVHFVSPHSPHAGNQAVHNAISDTYSTQVSEPSLGSGVPDFMAGQRDDEDTRPVSNDRADPESDKETATATINSVASAYMQDALESTDALATRLLRNMPSAHIDERIDAVVELALSTSVSAERLMTLAQRLRRVGNKPVLLEAKQALVQTGTEKMDPAEHEDERSIWCSPQVEQRYQEIRIAVQLANRSGALNEIEFSEFASGVRLLAKALDTTAVLPTMQETVARARQLDTFAAQCDMQLSINVLSDGAPWSAQYVQQTALQDGLVLSRDGSRFVKLDEQNHPIFMLYCGRINFLRDDLTYSGSPMITLLLDVPAAEEEQQPFRTMLEYARVLGGRIDGRIVDDQRQLLSELALASIEKRLMALYEILDAAGLPPGAQVTRRLFSNG